MKISFQMTDNQAINTEKNRIQGGKQVAPQKTSNVNVGKYGAYFQSGQDRNGLIGGSAFGEKGKTLTELQQEAGNLDVGIMQDYKTVLSNTMSSEDYAQLEKEGFDFGSMDPEETVTIVDKIKAELARSGKQIIGYTDDLDMDTLSAAVGSAMLAQAITGQFADQNVPVTEENISNIRQAWDMTSQLQTPTEGSVLYMVENKMEPQIWNFYLAQNSGAMENTGQSRFYAEDIDGYYTETAAGDDLDNLQEQIDRTLEREGLTADDESRERATALLAAGIPLDAENMERMERLQAVTFPVSEETFARSVAVAIAEGKEPIHADLNKTESIYDRANRALDQYQSEEFAEELARSFLGDEKGGLEARKQLEEIRLRMTAEVNVKLLKSGFAIDTAPMEELIEALREAERQVAADYFPGEDTVSVERYQLFHETNRVVEEIPTLPAALLGQSTLIENGTLQEFHSEGVALQETYTRAGERYETMMTAPRRDLGDSMRKAFANVDDILEDLSMEPSEENRKAVRILGYNRMEIDAENIARVSAAREQVEQVVRKMTPAAVLQMIRDGKNPLNSSFAQLEEYFDQLPDSYKEQSESYSRFLYGMERDHEITPQERESFIGIYRLIHQIEKADGAAIGALVNTNAELHFSNLLSAVRSGKFKSLDARISDSFGNTVEVLRSGASISDQVAKAFVEDTGTLLQQAYDTEENEDAYCKQQLDRVREAALAEQEAVSMLERADLPQTSDHLLAAMSLTDIRENFFKRMEEKRIQYSRMPEEEVEDGQWNGLLETLDDKESFRTAYTEMTEEMQEEVQTMSLARADTSIDVTALQMMHKQLGVMQSLSDTEEYMIPLYLEGELTQVHLTIMGAEDRKGMIHITTTLSDEPIEARLQLETGRISGFLVGNSENAVTRLKRVADIFNDSLQNEDIPWEAEKLPVVSRGMKKTTEEIQTKEVAESASNGELYRIAKLFLQAVKAES